jgi:hypothetical protein
MTHVHRADALAHRVFALVRPEELVLLLGRDVPLLDVLRAKVRAAELDKNPLS